MAEYVKANAIDYSISYCSSEVIDEINNVFEEKEITTVDWSTQLAGKIKSEKLVNHLLDDNIKGTFQMCFQVHLQVQRAL